MVFSVLVGFVDQRQVESTIGTVLKDTVVDATRKRRKKKQQERNGI